MKTANKYLSVVLVLLLIMSTTVISVSAMNSPTVSLSNTSKGVVIKWGKVNGASKYVISRRVSSEKKSSPVKTIKSGKAGSFTDTKVKAGKQYQYTVAAYSGANHNDTSKAIVYLKAPKSVKAKSYNSKGYVKISWKKSAGGNKYAVYRGKVTSKGVGKYKKIGSTSATKFSDWSVKSGYDYKYKVKAVNGKSKSSFSTATKKVSFVLPAQLLVRMSDNYKGVSLYWGKSKEYKKFRIYRSTGKSKSFKKIADINASDVKRGLPVEIKYSDYYISLVTSAGISKKEIENQTKMAMFTDNDVTIGQTYNYYIEVETDGSKGDKMYRSDVLSIKYNDVDVIMEAGETSGYASEMIDVLYIFSSEMEKAGASIVVAAGSDNLNVATIDGSGVVTAISSGETNINIKMDVKMKVGKTMTDMLTIKTKIKVRVIE